jgi:phosphatidylglycerophosphate synthase
MQAVFVIPESATLQKFGGGERILTREIAGVPLLIRVIATAMRAGVTSVLIVWPPDVDRSIWDQCAVSPVLRGLQIALLVRPFDPRLPASWAAIAETVEERFYWLPWNWVTNKRALAGLALQSARSVSWDAPALLEKQAVLRSLISLTVSGEPEGVLITSASRIAEAERFLVAHSGKPSDGIYSRFNRLLCRPAVRMLTHTPVTPNWVTLGGLVVAIAAALMYAQGHYAAYVTGALLFFLSGLFDEADGMLARIKFRESVFGTWFEGFVDEATYLLLFGGITAGLYRERGPRELTYGYLLLIGCALAIAVTRLQRKMATAPGKPHEYAGRLNHLMEEDSSNLVSRIVRQIHIFIKKGVAIHYLLIFTVLGGLPWLLRLAAVGANLTWIVSLYFNQRFFRRGKAGAVVRDSQIA